MTYIFPLSSIKLTGWQKETGLGLEKTILQDRAHGSICPSSPLHGLITPVIDIKIKSMNDIETTKKCLFLAQNQLFFIKWYWFHITCFANYNITFYFSIFINQNKWLFTVMRFYHCMAKKINVLFLKLCGIRLNVATLINFALLERGNT